MIMKKLIVFLLCLALCICLISCKETDDSDTHRQNSDRTDTTYENTDEEKEEKEEKPSTYTSEAGDNDTSDVAPSSSWQNLYLDILESDKEYRREFALVYVDSDNIPELYIRGICEAEGDLVCSYKNGEVITQHLSRTFGGRYIEREGMIANVNGHMGYYYTHIYTLDENGFTQILNANYTEKYKGDSDNFTVLNEYFIDTEMVTEDVYTSTVNTSFDFERATMFYDKAESYDTIKQQIINMRDQ
jgi:hypothetical protein